MTKEYFLNGKLLTIVRLLGKGKGGYSYLVSDGEKEYVCKQIHHEPCEFYDFGDAKFEGELKAYATLREVPILNIPALLETNHEGEYLIKEYIKGDLISDLASYGAISTDLYIQSFQLSESLKRSSINLDYFPTNFIVRNNEIYYIDYELNEYMEEWDFTHWGIYYWLNEEGMKLYNKNGSFDLLHPDHQVSKPRTLGFENTVAELKALYQRSAVTSA